MYLFYLPCEKTNYSSQNGVWLWAFRWARGNAGSQNTHTHCSQTVITSHPCPITAGFMTVKAKVINLSPNPERNSRHEEDDGLASPAHSTMILFVLHGPTAICLAYLPLCSPVLFHHVGHSRLEGAGVGYRKTRLLRWDFPLSLLALWGVGGRGDWWPATDGGQPAGLLPLQRQQRVLERPGGESLCQVSIRGSRFYLNSTINPSESDLWSLYRVTKGVVTYWCH